MDIEKEEIIIQLVNEAVEGEKEAFCKLINIIAYDVIGLAYSFTHNLEDAKDIFQEVCLKIFKGLNSFRGKSKFTTWVYRITVNTSIDFLRKRKTSLELKEQCIKDTGDFLDEIDKKEKMAVLKKAVDRLSDKQKKVFILRHFHNFTIKKISRILGCSQSSVKTHLIRAIENLKKVVKSYEMS